ncbi:MAG TPA: hypothetical protein PLD59_12510 [Tepidisphaeraceae bacterium]|nr:hypothetical protein [Tepidisphaeraceae bacterium]
MSRSPKFATLVAVGPGPAEIDRVADLVDAIAHCELGPSYFVMVDDARCARDLTREVRFPITISPVSIWHDRSAQHTGYSRGKGICSVILTGLSWIARHADDAKFVLKMDTDALAIAPFAERVAARLAADPRVGMLGAHTITPNGTPRDTSRGAETIRAIHRPPIPWLRPRRACRVLRDRLTGGRLKPIRTAISAARQNGYAYGEHCLGGAYALAGELVRRMHSSGHLDQPQAWLNIDSPEDVMMGMYTRAVGLTLANCVDSGDVFGVRHEGLPFMPQECISRGYGIIHAVKNDPRISEREIRSHFAALRKSRRGVAA